MLNSANVNGEESSFGNGAKGGCNFFFFFQIYVCLTEKSREGAA